MNLPDHRSPTQPLCSFGSLFSLFSALLLTCIASINITAQTFQNYESRVSSAVQRLDTLTQVDETESEGEYGSRLTSTVDSVRGLLPPSEKIDWNGTSVTVDNQWLHNELNEFQRVDSAGRKEKLKHITERLLAIEEQLKRVDTAVTPSGPTKDAARKKLTEILSRSEFTKQADEGSALTRLIKRLMEWIQKFFPKREPMSPRGAQIFTQIAQALVVLIALGVLAYALKMFAPQLFQRTGSKKKGKSEPRIVLGETLAPDQSASDLLAEAETLARRGELRTAIRKCYIALLVELGDRKIISLAQYKTNRDYLRAVRRQPLYADMKGLTESFERHWYGFADATPNDWTTFRAGYNKAVTRGDSIAR